MTDAALATSLSEPAALAGVAIAGLAVFVAPGALVLATWPLRRGERPAFAFAASLVLLATTFAVCLFLGASISIAPGVLAALTVAATMAARRGGANTSGDEAACSNRAQSAVSPAPAASPTARPAPVAAALPVAGASPVFALIVLASLTCVFVAAAVAFAPVGSVDRWWYLAYVRAWLDAPVLSLAEPFLGTGQIFARFGVHPWLFGLATWSHLSGVDPVVVYERGAPVIAVLASVSASWALARELFGNGARARLSVLASMLLWSGAMVPLLARAGEDKVMATAALLPLCSAAFLRSIRARAHGGSPETSAIGVSKGRSVRGHGRVELLLLGIAAVSTASVHALAYAFVLVALLPTAALLAVRKPQLQRGIAIAVAVLLAVALAPAASGVVVRERLDEIGADLATPDHPVVRVHAARERLLELPLAGYVVHPRLLLHPLVLLALAGIVAQGRRRRDTANRDEAASGPLLSDSTAMFLVATTLIPLAVAFVPPLPALAGAVIPPWMVYRVLWLLPLAPLAAIGAGALAARFGRGEAAAATLLLALGLPVVADGTRVRLADVRSRTATPATESFHGLVDAVASLPPDALVVAAPELSERLPAFTARHVAAALDRSTIVFTGSRERGEARLRARAALLAGDDDGFALAEAAGIHPTHAVFDPSFVRKPTCGRLLYRDGAYALCELAGDRGIARSADVLVPSSRPSLRTIAEADCGKTAIAELSNPWTAQAPIATCRIDVPSQWRGHDGLHLVIESRTGRAADELRITIAPVGNAGEQHRATVRTTARTSIDLLVPPVDADRIEVHVASSFLPVARPRLVALATP